MENTHTTTTDETDKTAQLGVTGGDRQQILLDDLRHEVQRLADAVERQNELLAQQAGEQAGHEVVE